MNFKVILLEISKNFTFFNQNTKFLIIVNFGILYESNVTVKIADFKF